MSKWRALIFVLNGSEQRTNFLFRQFAPPSNRAVARTVPRSFGADALSLLSF
jgi:hypothetical protein